MFEGFYRFLDDVLGYTHPVHPTQINMPIGLAVGALAFALGTMLFRKEELKIATRYSFILAFLFIFPTVLSGVMDWFHFYGGVWLLPIKVKVGLAAFFFLVLIVGMMAAKRPGGGAGLVLISTMAVITATALGYFGAKLVFGGRAPRLAQFEEGEKVFRHNCTGCHLYGGNIIRPGKPIIGSHALDKQENFVGWIRNPRPPMPKFPPSDIPDEQVRKLYAYLSHIWGRGH